MRFWHGMPRYSFNCYIPVWLPNSLPLLYYKVFYMLVLV